MIHHISLQNFKCFKDRTHFPVSKLNLLTGINGRGKSTLLQSILLFYQSIEKKENMDKLFLNGSCIELGNTDDLKNSETPKINDVVISFEYVADLAEVGKHIVLETEFHLNEDDSDDFALLIKKALYKNAKTILGNTDDLETPKINDVVISFEYVADLAEVGKHIVLETEFPKTIILPPFSKVHYIAADRLGPLKYHDKVNFGNFINVGSKGQIAINVLAKLENELVHDNLYLGNDAKTLLQQTEEWLNYIFDGAKITIKGKERESSIYYILLNTKSTKERYKPSNVGFGYTYILPVIVSGLIAKKDEILIVENPEAHLHPKAQSRITEFLSKVASCGVQVFIESHSEHILNGIRIAMLRDDIAINRDDISILYFQENTKEPFVKLNILEDGSIDNWVDGFFDQEEIDLAQIFRLSRKK
jgi:predicted ATPase